jgi:hypothetical protein
MSITVADPRPPTAELVLTLPVWVKPALTSPFRRRPPVGSGHERGRRSYTHVAHESGSGPADAHHQRLALPPSHWRDPPAANATSAGTC